MVLPLAVRVRPVSVVVTLSVSAGGVHSGGYRTSGVLSRVLELHSLAAALVFIFTSLHILHVPIVSYLDLIYEDGKSQGLLIGLRSSHKTHILFLDEVKLRSLLAQDLVKFLIGCYFQTFL